MTTMTHDTQARPGLGAGLVLALVSATSFGLSGTLAKGLLDTGWSPAAAVTVRVGVAAAVLAGPGLLALRGRWSLLRHNAGLLVAYGVVAVAGCQFAYFSAVERMPVALALLIEYTAPVAVVCWLWVRHGNAPTRLALAGALLCSAGLVLVLDVIHGLTLDVLGVAWSLVAMLGAAFYFVVSARQGTGLPPITLAAGGLVTGTVVLTLACVAGVLPMRWATEPATYGDRSVPWWLLVLALGVVTAAVAYTTGVAAGRRLGSRLASFVALSEVLAGVVFAWLLLGEAPSAGQLLGGGLILGGVVVVKLGERPPAALARAVRPRAAAEVSARPGV